MKEWLLEKYSCSTFKHCPHEPSPTIEADPIRIHLDPNAIPKPAFTAATVPIHLRKAVSEQIQQDVAKGIIEPVKSGVPTVWQARMHVVSKPDGTPRRTIDFHHLNKFCKRETQHVVPPYKQARLVPHGGYRTVTDAKDGYHAVPLAEEDRHLTTFITEEGRFQYRVAPQGYLASGDGYNQRYDNIIADVSRKTKCVDDVLMWDDDESLEAHWWRVIDFLILVGSNGITLNPKKFQFCQREVEFAGFRITQDSVKPLPKYLDVIRNFPRPTDITGIRSWFGLVHQVSHYAKLTKIMLPFKPLLSPKTRFRWDDELEHAFQESKLEIIEAIKQGVEIFEPGRTTSLSPDWSRAGIGYFLYQKHCSCPSKITTCCEDGWRIVLAGSRFLNKAEKNYWPVEGEALAVVWALEDTRFFTVGCTDLHIQTDHRPLTKLLGDRTLDEMNNRRLINLKERSMGWQFEIHHVPGRLIPASDATSRNPHNSLEDDGYDDGISMSAVLEAIRSFDEIDNSMEIGIVAAAKATLPPFQSITWERVKDETSRDIYLLQLIDMAENGFPDSPQLMPPQLLPYWRFRDELSAVDGVLMYGSRVVIPPQLREQVVVHLHSAHQGISQMNYRASDCVFWPGITSDIERARAKCTPCNVNAPSQSKMPPVEPFVPSLPFEAIASDFFQSQGKRFLLTVDRFSNWPDLRQVNGATGLIEAYLELFATFGVPRELSSDGGPEYVAKSFKQFLRTYDVRHRQSSAYHPQSNGRAEVTVKTMKRLLSDNIDQSGKLNTDAITRAMLQIRNTPERDSGLSPAQILFGRTLRDTLPLVPPIPRRTTVFDSKSAVNQGWKEAWAAKEDALKARMAKQVEKLQANAHVLKPLQVGDLVRIQNQTGSHPNKWDKTGTVVQVGQNDQYIVKVDGSWRLTLRNRKFLRKMLPRSLEDIERKPAFPSNHAIPLIPDVRSEPSKEDSSNEAETPTDLPSLNDPVLSPPAISVTPPAPPDVPHYHASEPAGNEQAIPTTRGRGRPRKRGFTGIPSWRTNLSDGQPTSNIERPENEYQTSSPERSQPSHVEMRPQRERRTPDWYGDRV